MKLGDARYCPPLNATLLRMSTVSVAFLLRILAVEFARAGNKVMVKFLGVKCLELNICETIHEVPRSADYSRLG